MNVKIMYHSWLLLIVFWVSVTHGQAPDTPPKQSHTKVGLCLSGGGAKGLAHIGLLKIIDSLGIRIDYITGTSMGSVVGGLYAVGYSGKQIDSIARSADWDKLLSRYVPMSDIYIDEKDEYQRYIAEIPIEHGKPNFTGVIDGQELMNLFSRLTSHVSHIRNFDSLPIPYHCMAVDIVHVKPVELRAGNLALAMRSSMSIPTIFKPVTYDSTILVDGGFLENFPVEQLKQMGADFIIGSYTGGRLFEENELNTLDKILVQTSLAFSIERAKKMTALCDIMNNLTEGLGVLNAGSFNKSDIILDSGESISALKIPELIRLAELQKAEQQTPRMRSTLTNNYSDSGMYRVKFSTGSTDNAVAFAASRADLDTNKSMNYSDIHQSVTSLYGSRLFSSVYYDIIPDSDRLNLVFNTPADYKVRFKPALHYDSERGIGLILNLTLRNVLGSNTRAFITVDLAESPKLRISYRKYLQSSKWSLNTLLFIEQAEQRLYQSKTGLTSDIYSNRFSVIHLGVNYATSPQSLLSINVFGENGLIKPKLENEVAVRSEINQAGLHLIFIHNTLDRPFFSSKGSDVYVSAKVPVLSNQIVDVNVNTTDSIGNATSLKLSESYLIQPYLKSFFRYNQALPLSNKLTLNVGLVQGFQFIDIITLTSAQTVNGKEVTSTVPINDYFYLGGTDQRSRPYLIGLAGLREGELLEQNFYSLKLGFQYEVIHKLYAISYVQYHTSASSPRSLVNNAFNFHTDYTNRVDKNGDTYASLSSLCFDIGYMSPLGPIHLVASKASAIEIWRFYISFGFKF